MCLKVGISHFFTCASAELDFELLISKKFIFIFYLLSYNFQDFKFFSLNEKLKQVENAIET